MTSLLPQCIRRLIGVWNINIDGADLKIEFTLTPKFCTPYYLQCGPLKLAVTSRTHIECQEEIDG